MEEIERGDKGRERSAAVGRLWNVLLQPQFGAEGVEMDVEVEGEETDGEEARRSQCFFVKTGMSEKAQ